VYTTYKWWLPKINDLRHYLEKLDTLVLSFSFAAASAAASCKAPKRNDSVIAALRFPEHLLDVKRKRPPLLSIAEILFLPLSRKFQRN
jgi:hypothetical protein